MDYDTWLSADPFAWTQTEKEQHFLPWLKELTAYHCQHCPPYGRAVHLLEYDDTNVQSLADIPMLPVSLFKLAELKSIAANDVFKVLTSSGTSGQAVSKIILDAATAQHQQLALSAIVRNFIGPSRLPMLIVDTPSILHDRETFTARGAAILGFSMFARHRVYALTEQLTPDMKAISDFLQRYGGKPFIILGFTFMIWKYLCLALEHTTLHLDLSQGIVLHGGGWKKVQELAVSAQEYSARLRQQFGITRIHNYYGMAEQTGSIYVACEYGHLHASIFSDILIRDSRNFTICPPGKQGIIQVLSPLAASYPGHSLLSEDVGTLLGVDDCPCGRKGKYFSVDGRIPAAEIRGCSDTHEA
jgi:hypothetical protein